MNKKIKNIKIILMAALMALTITVNPIMGDLGINLIDGYYENAVEYEQALSAMEIAADSFKSEFTDDISAFIDFNFYDMSGEYDGDPGPLGWASSNSLWVQYDTFEAAVGIDMTSGLDTEYFDQLQLMTTNYYGELNALVNDSIGDEASSKYLATDNLEISVNTATAKALGLGVDYNASAWCVYYDYCQEMDAQIAFNSHYMNYYEFADLTPETGLGSNMISVPDIGRHEIGHAFGFVSGVPSFNFLESSPEFNHTQSDLTLVDGQIICDVTDHNHNPGGSTSFIDSSELDASFDSTYITPMDLIRFSEESYQAGLDDTYTDDYGFIDITESTWLKYPSLQNGSDIQNFPSYALEDVPPRFSNGVNYQTSHWGFEEPELMAPTLSQGVNTGLLAWDIAVFDMIGFDVVGAGGGGEPEVVPEPSTYAALCISGLLGTMLLKRRK